MVLEELYDQVLFEGVIVDWIKQHPTIVKELVKQLSLMGLLAGSPITMAAYVNKFLQDNPEALQYGSKFLEKVASFVASNPKILELFVN